jgi:hypothetical protein
MLVVSPSFVSLFRPTSNFVDEESKASLCERGRSKKPEETRASRFMHAVLSASLEFHLEQGYIFVAGGVGRHEFSR